MLQVAIQAFLLPRPPYIVPRAVVLGGVSEITSQASAEAEDLNLNRNGLSRTRLAASPVFSGCTWSLSRTIRKLLKVDEIKIK